jgi:hypothetical protein
MASATCCRLRPDQRRSNARGNCTRQRSSSNACTTAPRVLECKQISCWLWSDCTRPEQTALAVYVGSYQFPSHHLRRHRRVRLFASHPRPRLRCCDRFLCFVLLSAFHSRIPFPAYRLLPILFLCSHRIALGLHLSPRISHTVLKHLARQSFTSLAEGRVTCPTKPLDSPTTSAQQQ